MFWTVAAGPPANGLEGAPPCCSFAATITGHGTIMPHPAVERSPKIGHPHVAPPWPGFLTACWPRRPAALPPPFMTLHGCCDGTIGPIQIASCRGDPFNGPGEVSEQADTPPPLLRLQAAHGRGDRMRVLAEQQVAAATRKQ